MKGMILMNISAVSKKFDLSPDTLRYYEREGLIPPVHRNESGYRDYDNYDMNWIYFVKCMRKAGVSVESMIEYTNLFLKNREGTAEARKDILREQKAEIEEKIFDLQQTLDYLNYKIDNFDDHLKNFEDRLDPYIQRKLKKENNDQK
ncbi:MerR family transcriptional regulator [Ligilactobacillus aviarius]|uniref:MerR family transcriptional regulator n=2 Tax=Ligilactobacillus aviarius TaxID=1606 RepID=UPI002987FEDA|nr:MerR family transcriptional regulator [Ligilactobacillus aviarius]